MAGRDEPRGVAALFEQDLVLKADECYLVGQIPSDGTAEPAGGLYLRDTRHLSRLSTTLNGTSLQLLASRTIGGTRARIVAANRPFDTPEGPIAGQTVAVDSDVTLGATLTVRTTIQNHGVAPLPMRLQVRVASDFRDLFDVRGFARDVRGELLPPDIGEDRIRLAYRGRDGAEAATLIAFDRPATISPETRAPDGHGEHGRPSQVDTRPGAPATATTGALATFAAILPSGASWTVTTVVTPIPASGEVVSARATLGGEAIRQATITTSDPTLNRVLAQSAADLATLQTSFPAGSLPAAGIPWFVAPFGRDSLIVGLQTLPLAPGRAAAILRALASLQGETVDIWRDEEPGKIPHEMRYGEMARLGEIPHTPYFGTVDATPLFVLLFAETVHWTGDDTLYRDLLPAVQRAVDWIVQFGDADGDGLVEYHHREPDGVHISHQNWKDSSDSLNHVDGTPATGLIAPVEVQGYVYAALGRLADVVADRGDPGWAGELRARAALTRRATEDRFWMEDEGYYAQALDGDKRQVRTISSNPGHLLWSGLPSPDRAARVAARLTRPDLDAGWGFRTLSSLARTYNPMSYHNGSVWPHDNSLVLAGLLRYGHVEEAGRTLRALVDVAGTDRLGRLPELFAGYERLGGSGEEPVPYPVSCSPQAWAAATIPFVVTSLLGLGIGAASAVPAASPTLPDWLDEIAITGLDVGDAAGSVTARRVGDSVELSFGGGLAGLAR